MGKEKGVRTFYIDCGTYSFRIGFCISDDFNKVAKFINWKYEGEYVSAENIKSSLGMCFKVNGYIPIIWLPKVPTTPNETGTLHHEIFHAICHCMRWANIPLTESSEEAYCHLIKYVTAKIYKKL